MNKDKLVNSVVVPIITASVVSLLIFFLGFSILGEKASNGRGVSSKEITKMMRNMMGQDTQDSLPVRSPVDRAERLEFITRDDVKEFTLFAEPIRWEYAEGKTILSWGYNGQVPGPEIRVTEGDKVRIVFTNKLPKATTLHWHGIDVPFEQDGVPGVTQKAIHPGETYTYEFIAKPAGTRFYHTHGGGAMSDEAQQLDMGLSGAFIIEPMGYQKPDKEYTLIFDEWQTPRVGEDGLEAINNMMNMGIMMGSGHMMDYNLFTINGRSFPGTEPMNVRRGDIIRLRLINAGTSAVHPMHLHGHQFKVVAVDGNPVPPGAQLTRNTNTVHPGETYDIEFIANNPGIWLFHCHELHHADGGMIVPLIYDGYSLPATSRTPAEHSRNMPRR